MNNRFLDKFLIVAFLLVGTFAAIDIVRRLVVMFNPNSQQNQQRTISQNMPNAANRRNYNNTNNNNVMQNRAQNSSSANNTVCNTDKSLSIREADSLYHRYLEYVLLSNLNNPEQYKNNKAVLQISVDKNGNILAYNISEQNCSNAYLNAILDDLNNSNPLQPFMPVMGNENRSYELRFNGNEVYAHRANRYNPVTAHNLPRNNSATKSCCINQAKEAHMMHSINSDETLGDTCNSMDIQANWKPVLLQNNSADVTFEINKNGTINITNVSSTNPQAGQAALNAITNTKCKAFPSSFNKDKVSVKYTFYVNDIRQY